MVRMTGIEPARPHGHENLNLACLPIPPHPHRYQRIAPIGRDSSLVIYSTSIPVSTHDGLSSIHTFP